MAPPVPRGWGSGPMGLRVMTVHVLCLGCVFDEKALPDSPSGSGRPGLGLGGHRTWQRIFLVPKLINYFP